MQNYSISLVMIDIGATWPQMNKQYNESELFFTKLEF